MTYEKDFLTNPNKYPPLERQDKEGLLHCVQLNIESSRSINHKGSVQRYQKAYDRIESIQLEKLQTPYNYNFSTENGKIIVRIEEIKWNKVHEWWWFTTIKEYEMD